MERLNNIWYVTLLLSAVAGFCDTVTFVAGGSMFSAHVTGNFIVFAYQIIRDSDIQAWIKLLTFPVFIISVITGGRIGVETGKRYRLLLLEGILLLIAGISTVFFHLYDPTAWSNYLIVMLVVFAMGLQNAFGKLYGKETYGPTTMMTGNVTQASLDLGTIISSAFTNVPGIESLKKQMITIGGFLTGCLAGALLSKYFALSVLMIPGLVLLICYTLTVNKPNPITPDKAI